jgi:type IV secretory pathway TrbL component
VKISKAIIVLIMIVLAIGILVGYFVLPMILKQSTAGLGESVFGTARGISPPPLP